MADGSVSIATLGIKVTTDAATAARDMDQATASAVKLQAATAQLAAEKVGLTQAEADLVRATASGEKVNRDLIAAVGDGNRALQLMADAKKLDAQLTAAAAKATEDYAARALKLQASLDPLVAAQVKLAARTKEANDLFTAGALSLGQHSTLLGKAEKAAEDAAKAQAHLSGATSGVTRELIVMGRELGRGDFTRMSGSATILAQRMGVMGAILSPVGLALGAVGLAAIAVGAGMIQGAEEVSKFNGALIATGNYAGQTAGTLEDTAHRIAASSDTTIGSAKKVTETLAESGKIGTGALESLADAAENYSRITGENADKFAKEYLGMTDNLVRFAVKHQDIYHDLTLQEVDQIAWLVKHGQEAAAQDALAADIDRKSSERLAQKVKDDAESLGFLQRVMHQAALDASAMWDAILGLGRPESTQEQAAGIANQIAGLQSKLDAGTANGKTPLTDGQRANLQAQVAQLQGQWKALVQKQNADEAAAAQQAKDAAAQTDAIDKKYGEGRGRTKQGPTDQTDNLDAQVRQQIAQVDAQIAEARKQQLQADLALISDPAVKASVQARIDQADYEKQIAEYDAKIAGIDKQIADIKDKQHDTHQQQQVADLQAMADSYARLKDSAAYTKTMHELAQNFAWLDQATKQEVDLANARLQGQEIALQGQADLSRSTYARNEIELQLLALKRQELENQQALIDAMPAGKARDYAQQQLDNQKASIDAQAAVTRQNLTLANGVGEAINSVQSFSDAIKRHDWLSAFNDLMQTLQTVEALLGTNSGLGSVLAQFTGGLGGGGSIFSGGGIFASGGIFGGGAANDSLASQPFAQGMDFLSGAGPNSLGGKLDDVSGSIESMGEGIKTAIGGTGTGTLSAQLGKFAGGALAGYAVGSTVGGVAANALGINQGAGSQIGSAIGSAIGMYVGGPIGAAIGSFLGDLAGGLFDNKPTNGAGFAKITPDGFTLSSSGKTSQQGAQLAQAFAAAIVNSEGVLKSAGVTTKETVTGVDIGTRDQPNVTFSDGHTERLGNVGDAGSAADAAMKELLQGATYVSDTEKKLVESMEAAGSSFDDIAKALQGYTAAQKLATSISDQILQLTDPQAYDKKQVTDAIQAQRDALKAASDAGYYTADQFAGLNTQLDHLQSLQLDEVLKKYAEQWGNVTNSLKDWVASLTAQTASPAQSTAQAYAALQAAGLAARGGDVDAAGKVASLGDAYLTAAKASSSSELDYLMAVAKARAIGSATQAYAAGKVGLATGGSFTVGGSGAGDTQNFGPLNLSPGEVGNISRADTMAALLAAIKSLEAKVASLQADNQAGFTKLASNTNRTAKVLETWDITGVPPDRDAEEAA